MPVPGSSMPVMIPRCTPIALVLAGLIAPHAALAQSADAPPPQAEGALPEPGLKPAPRLTPPTLTTPSLPDRSPTVKPAPPPTPAKPAAPRPLDEGALFLRADRIEGSADKSIEASGRVELRTRRETVLADWLQYNILTDEVWAKGDVVIRYGLDWIAGPEV